MPIAELPFSAIRMPPTLENNAHQHEAETGKATPTRERSEGAGSVIDIQAALCILRCFSQMVGSLRLESYAPVER